MIAVTGGGAVCWARVIECRVRRQLAAQSSRPSDPTTLRRRASYHVRIRAPRVCLCCRCRQHGQRRAPVYTHNCVRMRKRANACARTCMHTRMYKHTCTHVRTRGTIQTGQAATSGRGEGDAVDSDDNSMRKRPRQQEASHHAKPATPDLALALCMLCVRISCMCGCVRSVCAEVCVPGST